MKKNELTGTPIVVRVNAGKVLHSMQGGVGASWHAMSRPIPLDNEKYDYPVRHINPRGSGWGGVPPVSDRKAWDQICAHASWLGLNFIRVELSMRMYEPARNLFDWENEEMRALYRILDWCQASGAEVFLQQMWSHVDWNAYPGVHPLLSAPRSIDDFARGISALLRHLIRKKKYTCVKYFCITNEPPGGTWGYWWSYGSGSGSISQALKKVRETLDAAGLHVKLSGPDWTSLPPFDRRKIDFDKSIGAYDIHSYDGIDASGERIIRDWVRWAHSRKKPFFVTEFGNMSLGWGGENPGPKSFDAALSNASDMISCLNIGVDGMNRWSFVNRGDLDGQWQLIRTWDRKKKSFLKKIEPEPAAYFGFAIMSRYMGMHGDVVEVSASNSTAEFRTTAVLNKSGALSVYFINKGATSKRLLIRIAGHHSPGEMYLYQASERLVAASNFSLEPAIVPSNNSHERLLTLPAKSISVLTDYYLASKDPGIIR